MFESLLSVLLLGMVPVLPMMRSAPPILASVIVPAMPSSTTLHADSVRLSASGVIVTDLWSGQNILTRRPQKRLHIGSLTKLMTAQIIVERHALDEVVTVPPIPEGLNGNRAHLVVGDRYRVSDLLSALLVASANDAARALAVYHSGTIDAFVAEMNERAHALGLKDTVFRDPAGFDDPQAWSTAQDVAWLASFVLRSGEIRERLGQARITIRSLEGNELALTNTHSLLARAPADEPASGARPRVVAGKTGTTPAAGQCLLSIVEHGTRAYLVILLKSSERYRDMQILLSALTTASL